MILEIALAVTSLGSLAVLLYLSLQLMKHQKELIREVATALLAKNAYEVQKPPTQQSSSEELPYKEVSTMDDDEFFKHIDKTIKRTDNEDEDI